MEILAKVGRGILGLIRTFRLALPKLGVGWMFALLTVNFNRIAVVELNVMAVAVTAMLAMHYFLSPFQVIFGRIADRNPILGMRRTPYLLLASVAGSLVFLALPSIAIGMGDGAALAYVAGFALLLVFGVVVAIMGDSHHSLIAEVVPSEQRGGVISVVWTFSILSTIIAAGVMKSIMPEYTPAAMQDLYNLTPWVVIISALVGIVGIEKRLTGDEMREAIANSVRVAPGGNALQAAWTALRENPMTAGFFAFVFVSIFSIFLQDGILEIFGAEVFEMTPGETSSFQQMWGGGVLLGMMIIGLVSTVFHIKKRTIVMIGSVGTALGFGVLAFAALSQQVALVTPALFGMGLFTGFYNVGALSMMMDMTVPGATGLYMGLWGMAQAFGTGIAFFAGGLLHTVFIETGLLTANSAYFAIFGLEAVGMVVAALIIARLSVERFQEVNAARLEKHDVARAMEAGAAG